MLPSCLAFNGLMCYLIIVTLSRMSHLLLRVCYTVAVKTCGLLNDWPFPISRHVKKQIHKKSYFEPILQRKKLFFPQLCGMVFSPVSGNVKGGHFRKYLKIRESSYIFPIWHIVSQGNINCCEYNFDFLKSYCLLFKAV